MRLRRMRRYTSFRKSFFQDKPCTWSSKRSKGNAELVVEAEKCSRQQDRVCSLADFQLGGEVLTFARLNSYERQLQAWLFPELECLQQRAKNDDKKEHTPVSGRRIHWDEKWFSLFAEYFFIHS